jgi:hypothetical protein
MELIASLLRVALMIAGGIAIAYVTAPDAMRRRFRRWPAPRPDAWTVEQHARYVVQKLAREDAARQAFNVWQAHRVDLATVDLQEIKRTGDRLNERIGAARRLREIALVDLRLVLGLPEYPTQAECGEWGEAP